MTRVGVLLVGLVACGGEVSPGSPSTDAASSDDVALVTPHPPDGGAYQCGTGPVSCTCGTTMVHDGGGSCSPASLGGPSHCCAVVDDGGVAFSCHCQRDVTTCVQEDVIQGDGFCICGRPFSHPSHAVPECKPRRVTDRCCRLPGDGRCICGEITCDPTGAGSYEVSGCGPEDGVVQCVGGRTRVAACR